MADLELKSIEILREKPFLGQIFAENWDYWMIDEYQDTSPLQVATLSALRGDKPTYFVGDPQQSIYLFRGAEVRVFEEAQRDVERRLGEVRVLRRNYRSSPDLLLWINKFMGALGPAFQVMEPRDSTDEVARHCVTMLRTSDDAQELHAVVARVAELIAKDVSLEQICILGRTHRTLMDVSRALRERGYPTHVHSARGFAHRREVLDAQALWKFLVNPHDNLSLLILLRSPWFFVNDGELSQWMESKPQSLWRKLTTLTARPESVERLLEAQTRLATYGLARTFEHILTKAAMIDLSLVNDPAGRKESNLWKLILRARDIEREGGQSLLDFLDGEGGGEALEANEGDATSAQEPNSINLMTIHGSKGLEFDHVLIPRMGETPRTSPTPPLAADEGKFFFPWWHEAEGEFVPSPMDYRKVKRQRARELEEFDRWLYVALTRAKSTLTLSWSGIGRDSWASRSELFGRPAGFYEEDGYRFELRDGNFESVDYTGAEQRAKTPRKPWREARTEVGERQSVTEIASAKVTPSRSDLLKRWSAQNKGVRIHRMLEALKYGADGAAEGDESARFVLGLQSPPMRELILHGEAEWGFQVQTPRGVVPGQIDLWSKWQGKLYVVDYKSGSDAFKESAFQQLSLYAWALRKFGHREPAELVLIYPLSGKVERREFSEELFAGWELEFGGAKT